MKNTTLLIVGTALMIETTIFPALAASNVLVNSGLGQKAGDVTSFGVAICNKGTQALGSAPVTVTGNSHSLTVMTGALSQGSCGYSYIAYSDLGMTSGKTYLVVVTIDPNHTVVGDADQATYTVTVPSGQVKGVSTSADTTVATTAATPMTPEHRTELLAQLASMINVLNQLLAQLHAMGL
jgi:hypothetical protein